MQLINRSVGILVQFSDCVSSLENVESGVFHVVTGVRMVREACCCHICFFFVCARHGSASYTDEMIILLCFADDMALLARCAEFSTVTDQCSVYFR